MLYQQTHIETPMHNLGQCLMHLSCCASSNEAIPLGRYGHGCCVNRHILQHTCPTQDSASCTCPSVRQAMKQDHLIYVGMIVVSTDTYCNTLASHKTVPHAPFLRASSNEARPLNRYGHGCCVNRHIMQHTSPIQDSASCYCPSCVKP